MRPIPLTLVATSLAMALTGCASVRMPNAGQRDADVSQSSIQKQASKIKSAAPSTKSSIASTDQPYINHNTVRYTPPSGSITLNAQSAPLSRLLTQVAGPHYSLSFAGHAKASHKVTIQLHGATRDAAIRQLAASAGYAAVIKPHSQQIIIAKRATYVYHIPTTYLNRPSSSFNVGGNTAAGGSRGGSSGGIGRMGGSSSTSTGSGAGSGSMRGGSSSGGNKLTAAYHVSGHSQGESVKNLKKTLKQIAGQSGQVVLNRSTGLISVTANGLSLARTTDFLRSYDQAANTRVAIHAAILQVDLRGAFRAGVNWKKVISLAGKGSLSLVAPNGPPQLSLGQSAGSSGGTQATSQLAYTNSSVSAVIQALKKDTGVRIISRPSLIDGNGTPATLFSGTQLPYVGKISSSITGLSGTSTSGGGLSYVLNGLSLSMQPDVIGHGYVQIQLIPALSRVKKFDQFSINGNQIEGPEQALKQVYLQMLAPQNRTVILAGSQQSNGSSISTETPLLSKIPVLGNAFKGIAKSKNKQQLVILLRASILPAPDINPLVSESL